MGASPKTLRPALMASFLGSVIAVSQASAQTPSAEEMWKIIQEQQATIEALQAKISETDQKVEVAGEMIE